LRVWRAGEAVNYRFSVKNVRTGKGCLILCASYDPRAAAMSAAQGPLRPVADGDLLEVRAPGREDPWWFIAGPWREVSPTLVTDPGFITLRKDRISETIWDLQASGDLIVVRYDDGACEVLW
jgi:hypothetical protein